MKTVRDHSGRFWRLSLLSFALVVISPETVLAHGGPPAALGIIAAGGNDKGPTVILLNEGLGLKLPEAWSYMCPSLWGEVNQTSGKYPMSRSADGINSWVIGDKDLYLLRDQMLVAQHRPEFSRNTVIALGNDAKDVYALHFNGMGAGMMGVDLMRVREQPEPAVWSSPDYWSAITTSSAGVHIARVAGEKLLEVVTIDKDGKEQNRAQAMLDLTPLEIQLHAASDRLYVTANDGNHWVVGYFDGATWKQVLEDTRTILGPQASADGTLWISIQGALQRLDGDTPQPSSEARMITCLEQWNDWRYACAGSDMYKLTESGLGEQVFGMDGFHQPDPKLVPADMKDNCEQQWVLYTVDAVRSGINFVDWPMMDAGAAGAAGNASTKSAQTSGAAGAAASAPVAGSAAMTGAAPTKSSGGCSVLAGSGGSSRSVLALAIAVSALALGTRVRARRRVRSA